MPTYCLLLLLFLATTFLHAEDQSLYEFTLKNGQTLVGYSEPVGVSRLKIHIVFKGKVMAYKEVELSDVVNKKAIETTLPVNNDGPTTDKEITSFQDLMQRYYTSTENLQKTTSAFDNAFSAFQTNFSTFNPPKDKDFYNEQLKEVQTLLDTLIEAQRLVNEARMLLIIKGTSVARKNLEQIHNDRLKIMQESNANKINEVAIRYAQFTYAQIWLKNANLNKINEANANSNPDEIKRIKELNSKLSNFEKMRSLTSGQDWNAVINFLNNDTELLLYSTTR